MGCGNSTNADSTERVSRVDFDEVTGKKIPQFYLDSATDKKMAEFMRSQFDSEYIQKQGKKTPKLRDHDFVYETIFENVGRIEKQKKSKNYGIRIHISILVDDIALIERSLTSHFIFYNLSSFMLQGIVNSMFYCALKEDEFIFRQGDKASCYFIIDKGELEVIINEKRTKVLKAGEAFGEMALLFNAPRSASIRTKSTYINYLFLCKFKADSYFWALDRQTFRKSIEALMAQEYEANRGFIDQVSFFSFMTTTQRDSIAHALITTKFQPGQMIVREGDRADSYFVIKAGQVSVQKGGKEIRKMGMKDSFGEQALYVSSFRLASVRADTEVHCVTLGRDQLTGILGDKIQIIIFNNLMRWSFDRSHVLNRLTKIQIEKLALNAKIVNLKKDSVIYVEGEQCERLTIVLEGTMINKNQEVLLKGQCFGDRYLQKHHKEDKLSSSWVMQYDGVIAQITFVQFFKLIGGDLESIIDKNQNSHEVLIQKLKSRQACDISLDELYLVRRLGHLVYLVCHDGLFYVLRGVSKQSIIESGSEQAMVQERIVLEQLNFPFAVQYYRAFSDEYCIYFLTQYVGGLELFDVIRDIGLLNKVQTQFYVGQMILTLEYLHGRNIVHRDVRPENLMVNAKGYAIMFDLGSAKLLSKKSIQRTYTIIGTHHYMAPEVLMGKGYSFLVDLWSLGVCMYEFLCGGVPYAEDQEDPYEIYEDIMKNRLIFPSFLKDRTAKRLIKQLLNKQPEGRLGSSFAALKAHRWFDDLDWDKLYLQELQPPFRPLKETKSYLDMTRATQCILTQIKLDQSGLKKPKLKGGWEQGF